MSGNIIGERTDIDGYVSCPQHIMLVLYKMVRDSVARECMLLGKVSELMFVVPTGY